MLSGLYPLVTILTLAKNGVEYLDWTLRSNHAITIEMSRDVFTETSSDRRIESSGPTTKKKNTFLCVSFLTLVALC